MQSLALDVNVVSEEGQRAEMRDEDDDLLRAAEELGIDLSGVRAPAAAADEALEGEDVTEAVEVSTNGSEPSTGEDLLEEEIDVDELLVEVADLDEVEELGEGASEQEPIEETET